MYFIVSVPHAAPLDKNRISFPYICLVSVQGDNTVKDCRKVSIKHGARASGTVDRAEHQHCDGSAGAVLCRRGAARARDQTAICRYLRTRRLRRANL